LPFNRELELNGTKLMMLIYWASREVVLEVNTGKANTCYISQHNAGQSHNLLNASKSFWKYD